MVKQDEKKPLKVMRIIARLNVGGPALHCLLLSENLKKYGFETVLVTGNPEDDEASFEKVFNVQAQDFRLVRLSKLRRMVSGIGDLKTLLQLFWLIRKEKPDIVHTHTAKAGLLGRVAAFLNGVPVTIHTFHGHVLHGYFNPALSKLVCWLERLMALKTTGIVTLSPGLKKELSGTYRIASPEKFHTIPLGRDLKPFFNGKDLRTVLRKEVGASDDCFLIGTVGRLVPIKDQKSLLEACARLPQKNWILAIAGKGQLEEELMALAQKLGIQDRVHFLGWRNDLPTLYAGFDTFILTSKNEGTPLSIIESFASSCPVISTTVGGIPDMFSPGSWRTRTGREPHLDMRAEGILVPLDNPVALTNALKIFMEEKELRQQCGQNARQTAMAFTDEALVQRMVTLYQELLAGASC